MPYTKDFHFSPLGQRGGLSTYPVAGVVDGAVLSLNGTGISGTNATLTIGAGLVRFDGYPIKFNQFNVSLNTGVALDATTTNTSIKVYMSPTRKVPLFTGAAPDPAGFAEGEFAAKAMLMDGGAYDEYYVIDQIYVKENGAWREIQPFNGTDYPRAYGWNNMPYNEIKTNVNPIISLQPELPVFLGSKLPPHTARPLAMFRQTASIYLGEVTFTGGVAAITETMPEYHLLPI